MSDHRPWEHFLAGQIGGMAGVVAWQPFDTVKVPMQTTRSRKRYPRPITVGVRAGPQRGVLQAIGGLHARDGIKGFYRGVAYPLLATGCQKSLAFGSSATILNYLTQRRNEDLELSHRPHLVDLVCSGAGAGVANSLLVAPIDQLKIAQQICTRLNPKDFVSTAVLLLKNHNGRFSTSLYGAWPVTLVREIVGYSFYFTTYEVLNRGLQRAGVSQDNFAFKFLAGGVTGMLMWGKVLLCVRA